ncbi:MAG: thrombospondin type 3 repeat-containing protein [Polyangiaceae bacterium]
MKIHIADIIRAPLAECLETMDVRLVINKLQFLAGLEPTTREGCNPTDLRQSELGYSQSFGGADPASFNQGCLAVDPIVSWSRHIRVDLDKGSPLESNQDMAIGFNVCDGLDIIQDLWNTAYYLSIGLFPSFREAMEDVVSHVIGQSVGPYMNEFASQLSPFIAHEGAQISPPNTPVGLADTRIQDPYVRAALSRHAYGWFANAFDDGRPPSDNRKGYAVKAVRGYQRCEEGRAIEDLDDATRAALVLAYSISDPEKLAQILQWDAQGGLCVVDRPFPNEGYTIVGPAEPGSFLDFDYIIDRDRDSVDDPIDNCPTIPNEDQDDRDDDGIGSACDPCPYDPNNDLDGDGVCDIDANGKLDNCPEVPNPTQANCNEDSEFAEGGKLLGDACDPVPCPLFTTETELLYQSNNPLYRYQTSKVTNVVHTPVGATSRKGGAEVPVDVDRSLYRYCIDDPANFVKCTDTEQTNFSLAEEVASRGLERRATTWHRITIGGNTTGDLGLLTYQTGERRRRSWNWLADVDYWRNSPLISDTEWIPDPRPALNADPNVLPLPSWDVTGRLWILGDTGVGITELASTAGAQEDWVHPLASGTEFPVTRSRALANHYEVLSPLQVRLTRSRVPAAINAALLHCKYCPESLEVPNERNVSSLRDPRALEGGSAYPHSGGPWRACLARTGGLALPGCRGGAQHFGCPQAPTAWLAQRQ